MVVHLKSQAPPIRQDADGSLRVGESRVLLELVLRAYQDGETPEAIRLRYDALSLSDIYGVIAYYLRNRTEIEEYIQNREELEGRLTARMVKGQADLPFFRDHMSLEKPTRKSALPGKP